MDWQDINFQLLHVKSLEVITLILTTERERFSENWKSLTYFGPIRDLRSQGKLPPSNLKKQEHPESQSWDLLTWRRSHWSHNLVATLNWQFSWIVGCWVWTPTGFRVTILVLQSWGWNGTHIFVGFTSRNPTRFSQQRSKKISLWFCQGEKKTTLVK